MNAAAQANLLDCQLKTLPTQLQTPRLTVRACVNGDGADLHHAIQSSLDHLTRWMPWVNPQQTPQQSEAYCRNMQAHWILRKDFVFQMRHASDQRLLGALGLHDADWGVKSFMMGWWVSADAAGQGFATEAAQAVLDFGFEHLQASRIWASCDLNNTASERCMQKIGMQREGLLQNDSLTPAGALRSSLRYAKVAG